MSNIIIHVERLSHSRLVHSFTFLAVTFLCLLKFSLTLILRIIVHSVPINVLSGLNEARALFPAVLLSYSVTLNKGFLLGSSVSLPPFALVKFTCKLFGSSTAAVTGNTFQGSGTSAEPVVLWYVNISVLLIFLSCSERNLFVIHSFLLQPVWDLIKALSCTAPTCFLAVLVVVCCVFSVELTLLRRTKKR